VARQMSFKHQVETALVEARREKREMTPEEIRAHYRRRGIINASGELTDKYRAPKTVKKGDAAK